MILGLDISTSNIGWCILSHTGDFVNAAAISFDKKPSIFERASQVREALETLNSEYDITKVFIEENLQAFRPGFSSAKTIVTLARFNGIVSFLCHETFSEPPSFLNVNAARKSVGLKINRQSEMSTKEQVLAFTKEKIPSYGWPEKTLKSGPRKGHVIPAESCYDIADAYIIACAGCAYE